MNECKKRKIYISMIVVVIFGLEKEKEKETEIVSVFLSEDFFSFFTLKGVGLGGEERMELLYSLTMEANLSSY